MRLIFVILVGILLFMTIEWPDYILMAKRISIWSTAATMTWLVYYPRIRHKHIVGKPGNIKGGGGICKS